MRKNFSALVGLSLLVSAAVHAPLITAAHAAPNNTRTALVQNLRFWRAPDNTRLVFDLSAPVSYRVNASNDTSLVLDLVRTKLAGKLPAVDSSDPLVAGVVVLKANGASTRIQIDLKKDAKHKAFLLKPAGPYGHRLVIDLYDPKQSDDEPAPAVEAAPKPSPSPVPARTKQKEVVVAIDAGHGGEDPGAIGRRHGTREKDVTLAIAKELARQVNAAPGMKAVLTRGGDYYVPLDRRFKKARNAQADIFVSIHADALPPGHQATGASVYALSERGATHALARFLADKENAADQIGGVNLNDKDATVRKVLVDLSQSKSIEHSLQLGADILSELRHVGAVHLPRVAQAGFAVLKAPDVPSVLVETAFISNPVEERKLRSADYQADMARGILLGLKRYVARQPSAPMLPSVPGPVAPAVAAQAVTEHVVQTGETLVGIARQHNVHVDALRFFNNLQDDDLSAGTKLRIPVRTNES